jgi:cell filamentation protein
MYEVEDDTYCYPGTTVLKNKLELKNQNELDAFETEITAQRASEPLPPGGLDYERYCAIHRHFFQDVYAWAGKRRTVRISKGGSAFCYPENIEREMQRLFAELAKQNFFAGLKAEAFAKKAAHFLAELNAIHPFREGNGRTQLSFLTLLADDAGHPLNLEKLDPKAILDATIESFGGSEERLVAVIEGLISR